MSASFILIKMLKNCLCGNRTPCVLSFCARKVVEKHLFGLILTLCHTDTQTQDLVGCSWVLWFRFSARCREISVSKCWPYLAVTTVLPSSQVHESFHKHLKPLQAKLWSLLVFKMHNFPALKTGCLCPFFRHLNQTFQILVAVRQWIIVAFISTFINWEGIWGECVEIDDCF